KARRKFGGECRRRGDQLNSIPARLRGIFAPRRHFRPVVSDLDQYDEVVMRVTTQGTFAQVNYNLQRAYKRFGTAQQVVTTGLRINQLSDDPSGAVRALGLQSFSSSISQYQKNIDTLQPFLQQTDSTLSQIEQDLTSARTIAVASANDTQSASDRATAATQVAGLLSDALAAANMKFGNGYIFAGFANG